MFANIILTIGIVVLITMFLGGLVYMLNSFGKEEKIEHHIPVEDECLALLGIYK